MKLQSKIALLVTGVAVGIGVLSALIAGQLLRTAIERGLERETVLVAQTLAEHITQNVIAGETIPARQALQEIVRRTEDVDYVFVVGFDNAVFAHSFDSGFPRGLVPRFHELLRTNAPELERYRTSRGPMLDVGYPLIDGMSAHIHIGINESQAHDQVSALRAQILGFTLGVALLGIGVGVLASQRITRPLARLADSMLAFGKGGAQERIDLRKQGGQEVADLTCSFNRMISDRKRAEAELKESEEKYRSLFEVAGDAIFIMDVSQAQGVRFLECNERTLKLFGCDHRDQIIGKTPTDFSPLIQPDGQPSAEKVMKLAAAISEGHPQFFEWRHHRLDGTPFEVEVLLNRIELGGQPLQQAVVRDITERKRAEEAARESQRALSMLISNLPGMVYHCRNDPDWTMEFVSEGCLDLTGHPSSALVNNTVVSYGELIHPDDREMVWNDVQGALRERRAFQLLYRIVTAAGEEKWVWEQGRGVFSDRDELLALEGFITDITDRKRAKEALLSEKLLSENYINSLPGLFYVFDEQRFVRWNTAWQEVTGYSAEELSAMYGPDFFEGEDRTLIGERMRKVFREGAAETEAELVTKDGRRIPYYLTGLRREFNGKPHLVGLGIDVTDRKQAEAERRELEAQLHQSQKMEAVGQLAGGVAHDFNNILTAILGNVELSMDSVRNELGPDHNVVAAMEQIEKAAQRASALTRQLLTFSRRDVMQPRALNLNQVLTDLDKMLRRLITEAITLNTVAAPELQSVRADAGQLEQVIVNLVVNAVHAMPDGGLLTLETQNATLDRGYTNNHTEARPGPHVLLAVSDTGHGMDAATRERVFEPFFTTKPVDKGTGLGLATVHGIVNQSGGHIMVYSEPGHGTTFKVYLPAIEAAPAGQTPISQSDAFPRGHETVLLCEDDPPVRQLSAESLRSAGYTVITADSGQSGLEAAQAHAGRIDLLITDVIMPDMNGRALSERLRVVRPDLPTLFISGYTSNVIARHGVLDEGVEFLEKPFSRERLLTKVRAVLGKARADA